MKIEEGYKLMYKVFKLWTTRLQERSRPITTPCNSHQYIILINTGILSLLCKSFIQTLAYQYLTMNFLSVSLKFIFRATEDTLAFVLFKKSFQSKGQLLSHLSSSIKTYRQYINCILLNPLVMSVCKVNQSKTGYNYKALKGVFVFSARHIIRVTFTF